MPKIKIGGQRSDKPIGARSTEIFLSRVGRSVPNGGASHSGCSTSLRCSKRGCDLAFKVDWQLRGKEASNTCHLDGTVFPEGEIAFSGGSCEGRPEWDRVGRRGWVRFILLSYRRRCLFVRLALQELYYSDLEMLADHGSPIEPVQQVARAAR